MNSMISRENLIVSHRIPPLTPHPHLHRAEEIPLRRLGPQVGDESPLDQMGGDPMHGILCVRSTQAILSLRLAEETFIVGLKPGGELIGGHAFKNTYHTCNAVVSHSGTVHSVCALERMGQ